MGVNVNGKFIQWNNNNYVERQRTTPRFCCATLLWVGKSNSKWGKSNEATMTNSDFWREELISNEIQGNRGQTVAKACNP